jgi:GntR family transcriptional regulator
MTSFKPQEQPLYDVVRRRILEKLQTGEWAAGGRIPTEKELGSLFSVSVGTVRKAVEDLVSERVLLRRAGIGTTVGIHTDAHVFDAYFNFVNAAGLRVTPTSRLLNFKEIGADDSLAQKLNLAKGKTLIRFDNLRLCDGAPAMLDRIWVARDRFQGLDKDSFLNRPGSIYGLYQAGFNTTVVRIREQVGASLPPAFVVTALKFSASMPVLKIERTAFTFGDEVVEYRERYVNSTLCKYQNETGLKA